MLLGFEGPRKLPTHDLLKRTRSSTLFHENRMKEPFPKHYHLMAVGGIGVSGLARLLRAQGHRVSGCDQNPSELTKQLEQQGVTVFPKHSSDHIGSDVTELIISTGIRQDHPEVLAARVRGIPVRYRIEALGNLMANTVSVGITGTHGKTSTSSLTAVALMGGGLDPTAFVGSTLPEFGGSNVRLGSGPFVAEIDESDPLFEFVKPQIAVLTNLEADHIGAGDQKRPNFAWDSLEQLEVAMIRYLADSPTVLYCSDWKSLEYVVGMSGHMGHRAQLETWKTLEPSRGSKRFDPRIQDGWGAFSYGLEDGAFYRATLLEFSEYGSSFTFTRAGEDLGRVCLGVPGKHNVQNALAALAVNDLLGGDFAGATAALETFRGAARRFEVKGTRRGALVVDDYAHHPTEVTATLEAARQGGRRVRVVFQPHRYLRTAEFWEGFADALMPADDVLILDLYSAGESPIAGVKAENIALKMLEQGHASTHFVGSFENALEHLERTLEPNDLVLTMGAGDITRLGPLFLAYSSEKTGMVRP